MGVSGLTTYLSKCGERSKRKIYVSHQPVVIDGNNLMFHLYSGYEVKKYHQYLFGGDCIRFAQAVREYFQKLKCCRIHPIVVFDGAYEAGKLKTRMKRFGQSLKENVRQSTPGKSYTTALMKDIVVEILLEQDIDHYQTEFEADGTVAFIAQQLSCPVLSSDSDFFIYANVTTIPFGTINFKKRQQQKNNKKGIEENNKKLSTHVLEGKCITLRQMCEEEFHLSDYRLLPLTAVVIGNDQISNNVFLNFMSKKNADTGKGKHMRIDYLVKWFSKQSSYEAALETLLVTINAGDRDNMRDLVKKIVSDYMGGGGEDEVWNIVKSSGNLQRFLTEFSLEVEKGENAVSNDVNVDKNMSKELDDSSRDGFGLCEKLEDLSLQEGEGDVHTEEEVEDEDDEDDTDSEDESLIKPIVPVWFLEPLYKCKFPTPICKILYNRTLYLTPQVEVTNMPSSHAISVPIIQVLAGILYGPGAVTLVSRDRYNPVKLEVPTITSLEKGFILPCVTESLEDFRKTLSHEKRLRILLQTLLIKPEEEEFIHEWPLYMKFWIAACFYYLRKLKKTKDLYIGVAVSVAVILSCLKSYSFPTTTTQTEKEDAAQKVSSLLKQQLLTKKLQKLFQGISAVPSYDTKKFWRTYDMARVFFYSQFQSVAVHAHSLNVLLGEPLRSPKFSTLDCNIVYNVCTSVTDSFGGDVIQFLGHHLEANSPLEKAIQRFVKVTLQGMVVSVPVKDERNDKKERRKKKVDLSQGNNDEALNRGSIVKPEVLCNGVRNNIAPTVTITVSLWMRMFGQ